VATLRLPTSKLSLRRLRAVGNTYLGSSRSHMRTLEMYLSNRDDTKLLSSDDESSSSTDLLQTETDSLLQVISNMQQAVSSSNSTSTALKVNLPALSGKDEVKSNSSSGAQAPATPVGDGHPQPLGTANAGDRLVSTANGAGPLECSICCDNTSCSAYCTYCKHPDTDKAICTSCILNLKRDNCGASVCPTCNVGTSYSLLTPLISTPTDDSNTLVRKIITSRAVFESLSASGVQFLPGVIYQSGNALGVRSIPVLHGNSTSSPASATTSTSTTSTAAASPSQQGPARPIPNGNSSAAARIAPAGVFAGGAAQPLVQNLVDQDEPEVVTGRRIAQSLDGYYGQVNATRPVVGSILDIAIEIDGDLLPDTAPRPLDNSYMWVDPNVPEHYNVYNAGRRNIQTRLRNFNVVEIRRETWQDFVMCNTPDYLEDYEVNDIRQHKYLHETEELVMVPTGLPYEVALRWVASRDETDSEQAAVVAATVENYCRDINAPSNLIMEWKQYVPNIANLITRNGDLRTQPATAYAYQRRWENSVATRTMLVYLAMLPLLYLILYSFYISTGEEISDVVSNWLADHHMPNEAIETISSVLIIPTSAELAKRVIFYYDGSNFRVSITSNTWVNFWFSLISAGSSGLSMKFMVFYFLAQLVLGHVSFSRGLLVHVLLRILTLTYVVDLLRRL
jgi:hypothetical protein